MIKNFIQSLGLLGIAASVSLAQCGTPVGGGCGCSSAAPANDVYQGCGCDQPSCGGCDSGGCSLGSSFFGRRDRGGQCGGGVGGQLSGMFSDGLVLGAIRGGCGDRYISNFGGWNGGEDLLLDSGQIDDVRLSQKAGWIKGSAFGRQINSTRRHEMEFSYRDNSADEFLVTPPAGAITAQFADGNVNVYSGMFNVILDSDICVLGAKPYIGGGVGLAYVDAEYSVGATNCEIEELALGYQAIVGLERQVNERISVFAEYRYFGTTDVETECVTGAAVAVADTDYMAENITFGFRLKR